MKDKQLNYDVDWAEVVDILAHEYGWTISYIQGLTMSQVGMLFQMISKRNNPPTTDSSPKKLRNVNSGKFQADDIEKQVGMMIAWGAKKEIDKDGRERYIL